MLDSSGNNNHGTAQGDATTAPGLFGRAGRFSGNEGSHSVELDIPIGTTPFTMAMWIRPTGLSTFGGGDPSEVPAVWGFTLNGEFGMNDQQVIYSIVDQQLDWDIMMDHHMCNMWLSTPPGSVPLHTWTHLAFRWDTQSAQIFVNGQQVDSGSDTCGYLEPNTLFIGADRFGYNIFNGSIDELMIWDRILDADQIRQIYEIGR